ncbi:MAG TPA: PAS domain S-box protein [Burkholderiaceae bacterium]|jgi:PAS domain S-box-containing protein|nr:PAS domain S-box protein [Burkholderiaceae bacterium]
MATSTDEILSGLQQEQLKRHRRVVTSSVAGAGAMATMLAALLWDVAPRRDVWAWLACLGLALGVRIAVRLAHRPAVERPGEVSTWLTRYRLSFVFHGLTWALAGILFLPEADTGHFELVTLALAGIVTGSVIITAFDVIAALLFALPALAPLLIHLLLRGDNVSHGLAFALVIFMLSAFLGAVRAQRTVRETIELRLAQAEQTMEALRSAALADAARRELADKHRILDGLLQTTRQGFWFTDSLGKTTDVNPAMCELLGRPREDIVGRALADFFEPSELDPVAAELDAQCGGRPCSFEIGIQRLDGTRLHCISHSTPIHDSRGEFIGSIGLWTDITLRRQAEIELRTYELLANSITDPVSVVGEDAVYRMVNDAWCRLLGMARQDAIGRSSSELMPTVINKDRLRAFRECIEHQQPRATRGSLELPGLSGKTFETTYYPYSDEATGVRCVVVVSRDVTEEERAQAVVAASEAEQRALLEAFPGYITRIDSNSVCTYANRRVAERLGTTPDRMIGRTVRELAGEEGEKSWVLLRARTLAGEQVTYERRHGDPAQGGLTDQVTLAAGINPATGERVVYAFGIDITDRKRAEQALRDASEQLGQKSRQLQVTLDSIAQGIVSVEPDGRVGVFNRRMLDLLGLPETLLANGATFAQVRRHQITQGDLDEDGSFVDAGGVRQHSRADDGVTRSPDAYVRRTRTGVLLEVRTRPMPGGGLVRTYSDVTQYVEAQQALVAARDEAQNANRAKSLFLSHMSHELRTPLNAILGFGQLISSDADHPLNEAHREYLREILNGGRHLLNLINQILDLGSVEAGKLSMDILAVPLSGLIDECVSLVRPLADTHGVNCLASLPPDSDGTVMADRTRLKQVLLNLLGNAIKYNRAGGTASVDWRPDGDHVLIGVHDTGPGVAPHDQERLFQPFERLSAAQSAVEGSGIGLALSRRLVEAMDGEIRVDSVPGEGSTFWVRLPMAHRPAPLDKALRHEQSPPPAAPATSERSRSVLYIDDDPVNVMLMQAMLERMPGVRPLTAVSPHEGLTLAIREQPSLVLMDIQMPEMDGFEVLRRLRAGDGTRHIPVVAVSANAMPETVKAGLAAGFLAYLTKPVELDLLRDTVEGVLRDSPA